MHPAAGTHDQRVLLRAVLTQQHRRQCGRDGEGGEERADDSIGIGLAHRPEDPALNAAQGEERDEGGDDDQGREEDRLIHLGGGAQNGQLHARKPGAARDHPLMRVAPGQAEMAIDILHHNHGCIHQQAKIQRAQAEQIGTLAAHQHEQDGEEEGEGNGRRNHHRAAEIAQEQPLDDQDEQHTLDDVLHHRLGGDLHQILAVIDRHDAHARRQHAAGIDPRHLGLHAMDGGQGLLATAHQHGGQHHIIIALMACHAQARQAAGLHHRDIAQQDGRAAGAAAEHDVVDVIEAANKANALHHGRLRPDIDRARPHGDIARAHRLDHPRQIKPEGVHPRQVDDDIIGLGAAAKAGHIHHTGHALEAAVQHPILQGLQVIDGKARRADQAVAHDLANGRERRNAGRHTLRQALQHGQAVEHLLQGLLVIIGKGELHPHIGEAKERGGADGVEIGQARHCHLDGDGDVALNLLGALAGILGDDHHLRRHRVRIGLDVQPHKANNASGDEDDKKKQHQGAPLQ